MATMRDTAELLDPEVVLRLVNKLTNQEVAELEAYANQAGDDALLWMVRTSDWLTAHALEHAAKQSD